MGIYNSQFDFNKYRTFYAVAECRSFSKATKLLHITQPAISHTIKELERQLGCQLFVRENRNIKLTTTGEKLYSYVQKAFNNIIMAEKALQESSEELTGNIRLGMYSHISLIMMPKLIKEFKNLHKKVKFEIYLSSTDELKEKLKNKELDFVILQYPIFMGSNIYTEKILCEMENCFFTNKYYYDSFINNNKSIVEYPLILPTRGYDDINGLEEIFKRKNMTIKSDLTIYGLELTKKLVKEGLGIGWGLKKIVELDNDKNLYILPIGFDTPKTKFSIAYDKHYLNATEQAFLDYLFEYFEKEKF